MNFSQERSPYFWCIWLWVNADKLGKLPNGWWHDMVRNQITRSM